MTDADGLPDGFVLENQAAPAASPVAPAPDPLLTNAYGSIKDPAALTMAMTAAHTAGLPQQAIPAWVSAIHNESSWDLDQADGDAGEIGPGQMKPETGADMGYSEDQLRDPQQNLTASATYFGQKWRQAQGDPAVALTGYNAGNVRAPIGDYAAKAVDRMVGWLPDGVVGQAQQAKPVVGAASGGESAALPPGFVLEAPPAPSGALPPGFVLEPPPATANTPSSTAPAASSTPAKPAPPPRDASNDGANVIAPDAIAPTSPAASPAPAGGGMATSPLGDRPYVAGTVVRGGLGVLPPNFKPTAIRVPGQSQVNADISALGQGLSSGVASVVRGVGEIPGGALTSADANAQSNARAQLGVMDRIDAGQTVSASDDPLGYGDMSPEQRQTFRRQYAEQLQAMPPPGQTLLGALGSAVTGAAASLAEPLDRVARSMPVDSRLEGFQTAVARGAGNLAPAIAAGLTPAGIAAVAGVIGTQSFDGTYQDALAHGADQQTAYQSAAINGLAQAGLMSIPLSGAIMRVADGALRDGLMKTAINYASHGITMESAGEAGRFIDNYIARQTYDPGRDPLEGVGQDIAPNIALGLIVPAVHGGGDIARGLLRPSIEASPELQNAAGGISSELARVQQEPPEPAPIAPPAPDTSKAAPQPPLNATPPAESATPPPEPAPPGQEPAVAAAASAPGPVGTTPNATPVVPDAIEATPAATATPIVAAGSAGADSPPPASEAPAPAADLPPPVPDIAPATPPPSLPDKIDALASSVAAWKQSALHPDAALAQASYSTVGAASRALAGMRQQADRQVGRAEIDATLQQLTDAGQPLPFKPVAAYQGDDARRAMQAEPRLPGDLASVVAKLGGVRPDTTGADDLRSMDLDKRIGFFNRSSRFSVEEMANHLADLGYLGDGDNGNPNAPDSTSPLDTLMHALDFEKSGAMRFSNRFNDEAEQNAAAVRAYNENAQYVADRLGLSSAAARQLTRGQVEDALMHFGGGDYSLRGDQPALDALRQRMRAAEPDWASLPEPAKEARVRLADTMQTFMRFAGLPKEMGLRLLNKIADGNANGRYDPAAQAIDFALDTDWRVAPEKFFHEVMHPMLDLLPHGQKQAVRADANRWLGARRGDRPETNRAYLRRVYAEPARAVGGWDTNAGQQLLLSEAVSHMAEDTMADLFTPKQLVLRAIGGIGRFLDRVGNALNGEGYHTGQDVIRSILRGDKAVGDAKERLRSMPPPALPAAPVAPPAPPAPQQDQTAESPNPTTSQAPPSRGAPPAASAARASSPEPPSKAASTITRLGAPRDYIGDLQTGLGDADQAARAAHQEGAGAGGGKQPASSLDGSISGAADNGSYSLRDPERVPGIPGFYSPVARAALDLKQARATGAQMLAMISKSSGVKPEEMRWLGLDSWLRGQAKVTREQVLDYVRANSLKVGEVLKGTPEDKVLAASQQRAAIDRLSDLVARAGGSGNPLSPAERDELVRLTDQVGGEDDLGGQPTRYASYALPGGEAYRELLITLPDGRPEGDYDSGHWDEANVLAHTRFDERVADDGARTLMIQEAQSDWHQAGRKSGYRTAERPPDPERIEVWGAKRGLTPDQIRAAKTSFLDGKPDENYQAWRADNAEANAALSRWSDGTVPDAPFKTTWPALVMKRMIRWAVDNGFDRVAWSPGDVHADRYDLSKRISRLELHRPHAAFADAPDAGPIEKGFDLEAYDKNGRQVLSKFLGSTDEVADHVGKEIAERLLSAPEKDAEDDSSDLRVVEVANGRWEVLDQHGNNADDQRPFPEISPWAFLEPHGAFGDRSYPTRAEAQRAADDANAAWARRRGPAPSVFDPHARTRTLSGLDLKVGGEGMRGFYDKILPAETNKLIGRFGGKVERTTIPQDNPEARIDVSGDFRDGEVSGGPLRISAPVHSFNITPAMREAVVRDGMPLFSLRDSMEKALDVTLTRNDYAQSLRHALAPITTGSRLAQAVSARLANAERAIAYRFKLLDQQLTKTFTPAERRLMFTAMDDQSLFELELRDAIRAAPPGQEAAVEARARQAFQGNGLDLLTAEQRQAVIDLDAIAKQTWGMLQQRGLVDPSADGLPFYTPRFFILLADGKAKALTERLGPGLKAIDPLGLNVNTGAVKDRVERITDRALAAVRAKYGGDADLVRDIRVLPVMLAREQRSVVAADLVRAIKRYGEQNGLDLVTNEPPASEAADYRTIDHPAFTELRQQMVDQPDGTRAPRLDAMGLPVMVRVPLKVHVDFEGPLKAVLRAPPNKIYAALLRLKSAAVAGIMISPLTHVAVELGRAAPVLGYKVLPAMYGMKSIRLKRDADYMHNAIMHGLAPIGGSWHSSELGVFDEANFTKAHGPISFALGKAGDLVRPELGNAFRNAVNVGGKVWHQTMLWDRVASLQVGIYDSLLRKYVAAGKDPGLAAYMAAHVANRYAGALPREALGRYANGAANLGLFSRSYTLGNLGAIKDAVNGMPSYVRAQIERDFGPDGAKDAASILRRKAFGALVMDFGLYYLGNSILQDAINLMAGRQDLDDVAAGYSRRAQAEMQRFLKSPWDLLDHIGTLQRLTSTAENEPGKENRIALFRGADGAMNYIRNPGGKVGEDLINWLTAPIPTLKNKMSPMFKSSLEELLNADDFGRPVRNPNPDASYLSNAGDAAMHLIKAELPIDFLHGLAGAVSGGPQAGRYAMKAIVPLTGLQTSRGDPGGPEQGVIDAADRAYQFQRQRAVPVAREQFLNGDADGARQTLTRAGLTGKDVTSAMNAFANPLPGQVTRQRQFGRIATPDQQRQLETVRQAAPQTPAQRGQAQADEMFRKGHAAASAP